MFLTHFYKLEFKKFKILIFKEAIFNQTVSLHKL